MSNVSAKIKEEIYALIPPMIFFFIALNIIALAILAGLSAVVDADLLSWLWVAAGCAACLVWYVLRGWWVSGVGWRGLPDLLWAPVYIVWKVFLAVAGRRATEWLRTERERP